MTNLNLSNLHEITPLFIFLVILLALIHPLGTYMAKVYSRQSTPLDRPLNFLEKYCYKLAHIDPQKEMTWQEYASAILMASLGGTLLLFALLRCQAYLPLNPQGLANLSNDLAFNMAVSFITNTNWQAYSGETTLSHFSQMAGLGVQNFLSASMGMAILMALIRGIVRKNTLLLGNFWVDWFRGNFYILLPLSLIFSLLLGAQGVIQNFHADQVIIPLDHAAGALPQTIPGGPVASQIAIRTLGTNGGGFFGANAAHPFENPSPFSNFIALIGILLIPCSLCYTFGIMVNDKKQGWAILSSLMLILLIFFGACLIQEYQPNPTLDAFPLDQTNGNMAGKEVRFGVLYSTLYATISTATSNGALNASLEAFSPLGGAIPLCLILSGGVIFGGVGTGLCGLLVFILITVFICGLMVGRTPEYLGKKIQAYEIKMASIALFIPILVILFGTAVAVSMAVGQAGIFNPGAQGFTEILYGFSSTTGNNGSAFAGLQANSVFYNIAFGISMLLGRFWTIIPILAIAGSLANKKTTPNTCATLMTHTPLFMSMLVSVILLVGLLSYLPALVLGPISEDLALHQEPPP